MLKPQQRIIINGLLKLHFKSLPKSPFHIFHTFSSNGFSKSHLNRTFQSNPISQNVPISKYFTCSMRNHLVGNVKMMSFERLVFDPLRIRRYSTSFGRKVSGARVNRDGNLGKKVNTMLSHYKEAIGLQLEGLWKRNYLFVFGAGGVFVCITLWRIMFGIANTFVGLSEGMAKYGFLALSASMVAFAGLYLRSRHTINPDKVYRMAMRELNTSAGILEVMGSPLTGTDLRAYVMSGGGLSLSKFKPRLRSKRCFLIFPIRGSEMKGLVSVEVKKSKGKYDMKLLAVDIPMASGPDQRLFLFGDEEEYKVGGGLIADLRDPVVKAMAATKELEAKDDVEAEEDEEKELQDAERKHQQEINKPGKEKAWNWKWWPKL